MMDKKVNQFETDQFGEQISSLVDGEFSGSDHHEAVKSLLKDKESCHCLERYHLISDALKRNLPKYIDSQLASRIMAEVENEPTILAPQRTASFFGKRVAGLAVAASVATVAVLGVQFMYKEDAMAPSQQIAKVPVNKDFVSKDVQTVTQTLGQTANQQSVQSGPSVIFNKPYHPNLNKYLLDHNQRSASGVVQGVMPYARIVMHPDIKNITPLKKSQVQNQIQR